MLAAGRGEQRGRGREGERGGENTPKYKRDSESVTDKRNHDRDKQRMRNGGRDSEIDLLEMEEEDEWGKAIAKHHRREHTLADRER